MAQRVLGGILALMIVIILIGSRARRDVVLPPPPPPGDAPVPPPAAREVSLQPYPDAAAPLHGTPTIDLLAVLTIRRRIAREGSRVYLSEMFTTGDSTVLRWPDRPSRTYTVAFLPDTALKGWSPAALDDAKRGLQLWSGNSAGIMLTETTDTSHADITVHWTRMGSNPQEAGSTTLQSQDGGGIVSHAEIALSLFLNDSTPMTAGERRRSAGHEFGHALGLPHSTEPEDFMFARTELDAPSPRDQATLLLLYAIPPGPIRTP